MPLRTLLRGCVGSLVTRTLPSAFPLEQAQNELDPGQRAFLVRRAALARYLVDLVLAPVTEAGLVHALGQRARAVAGGLDRDQERRAHLVVLELAQRRGRRTAG